MARQPREGTTGTLGFQPVQVPPLHSLTSQGSRVGEQAAHARTQDFLATASWGRRSRPLLSLAFWPITDRGQDRHCEGVSHPQGRGAMERGGSWLPNVEAMELSSQEKLLLVFEDPVRERQYHEHFARTHRLHDMIGLGISSGLALAFTSRSSFSTAPAKVLLGLVIMSVSANVGWLAVNCTSPSTASKWRFPMVYILSWGIHFVVGCLPPLTYHSYTAPSTSFGAYMLILANSRFSQCLFAMGPWSSTGFLADLTLLTVVLFVTAHWNAQECEMFCSLQPALAERYTQLGRLLPFLTAGDAAAPPPVICLAARQFLQATLGCVLPLGLGLYREVASRRTFALEHRVRIAPVGVKDVLSHAGIAVTLFMSTIALLVSVMALLPQLEELPTLLRYGPGGT